MSIDAKNQSPEPAEQETQKIDISKWSLEEFNNYTKWKEVVLPEFRQVVESVLQGNQSSLVNVRGFPLYSKTINEISLFLQNPERELGDVPDELIRNVLKRALYIDTSKGPINTYEIFSSPDVSFADKILVYEKKFKQAVLGWIMEKDISNAKQELIERNTKLETKRVLDEKLSENDEDENRYNHPESEPSMENQEKTPEAPVEYEWAVFPGYGGYFRQNVYNKITDNLFSIIEINSRDINQSDLLQNNETGSLRREMRASQKLKSVTKLAVPYTQTPSLSSFENSAKIITDSVGRYFLKREKSQEDQEEDSKDPELFIHPKNSGQEDSVLTDDHPLAEYLEKGSFILPQELADKIKAIFALDIRQSEKINMVVKFIRQHFKYEMGSCDNSDVRRAGNRAVEVLWKKSNTRCYLANILASIALRNMGVHTRVVGGYYIKNSGQDGNSYLTRDCLHAWGEAYDDDQGRWIRFDATPKGDPNLDDERPDEADEPAYIEGDFGESEDEIMSKKELEKKKQEMQGTGSKDKQKQDTSPEFAFARVANCTKEQARLVLKTFERIRQLKDSKGENIQRKLVNNWKRILETYKKKEQGYKGPVRVSEGDEIDDLVALKVGLKQGDPDPLASKILYTKEKEINLFGGLDLYIGLDISGSTRGIDPKSGRQIIEVIRDTAFLFVDSFMECALLSRRSQGNLKNPLPVRMCIAVFGAENKVVLPLTDVWGEKEMWSLYRGIMVSPGSSTPDHATLSTFRDIIIQEREKVSGRGIESAPHRIELVSILLDGGSDNPSTVQSELEELRKMEVLDISYGITDDAKSVEDTYAPSGKHIPTLDEVSEMMSQEFISLLNHRIKGIIKKP